MSLYTLLFQHKGFPFLLKLPEWILKFHRGAQQDQSHRLLQTSVHGVWLNIQRQFRRPALDHHRTGQIYWELPWVKLSQKSKSFHSKDLNVIYVCQFFSPSSSLETPHPNVAEEYLWMHFPKYLVGFISQGIAKEICISCRGYCSIFFHFIVRTLAFDGHLKS